ncbi:MAG: hypothetical protein IPJ17_12950 [Holophagales bacterium]|nr:MAG: hypothetical protein IPJ17_12950 [Holophagales bacterium]
MNHTAAVLFRQHQDFRPRVAVEIDREDLRTLGERPGAARSEAGMPFKI